MKKWRKKSVSMLLIVLMLVTSLGATAAPQPAEAVVSGQTIVNKAMEYCGKVPYVSGGTKIDGTNPGADCSGFICRIYEKFGIDMWAHRTQLRKCGTNIGTDLNQAQLGDIIWFDSHVAIYAGKKNGDHMIVHETGGDFQNVVYTKVSVVRATLRGIIRIPGVNGNSVSTPSVSFSEATDPDYTSKASISDRNAVLVQKITKPSGTKVTKMGIILYDGNQTIKKYSENVSNVKDSTTTYHSWFDINKELGITLEPGLTYGYRFFGVFNGVEIEGPKRTFTTTGSPAHSNKTFDVTFYANPNGTTQYGSECKYGDSILNAFYGSFPPAQVPDGYRFDHWYVIDDNGQKVTIDIHSLFRWTHDIIIYPAYVEGTESQEPELELPPPDYVEVHNVNFVDPANMLSYGSYEIANGDRFTLPSRTPTRDGCEFVGWFTSVSSGTQITASTIADLDGDATFYARFRKAADTSEPDPEPGTEPDPTPTPSGDVNMTLTIGSTALTINGKTQAIDALGTTPIIRNDRTLLPVRAVIEGMGGSVDYDNDTRVVTLVVDGHSLYLMLDSQMAWDSRNDYYLMDVAPVSIGGRTMLPIRFVVEYFGGQVFWDNSSQTVTIVK